MPNSYILRACQYAAKDSLLSNVNGRKSEYTSIPPKTAK